MRSARKTLALSTSSLQTAAALLLAVSLQLANVNACPKGVYSEVPCVYKCCSKQGIFSLDSLQCISQQNSDSPKPFQIPTDVARNRPTVYAKSNELYPVHDKLHCIDDMVMYLMTPLITDSDNFRVSENGSLLNENHVVIAPPGQFCIDNTTSMGPIAAVCASPVVTHQKKSHR